MVSGVYSSKSSKSEPSQSIFPHLTNHDTFMRQFFYFKTQGHIRLEYYVIEDYRNVSQYAHFEHSLLVARSFRSRREGC
jgi:hypothetical protein